MLCEIIQTRKQERYTTNTLHNKLQIFNVENPQRGKRPEIIHYQCKSYTPKFYSKQVRVLWERTEYEISSPTKPNEKIQKQSPKTHSTWLIMEAVMYELSKICFSSTAKKMPVFFFLTHSQNVSIDVYSI